MIDSSSVTRRTKATTRLVVLGAGLLLVLSSRTQAVDQIADVRPPAQVVDEYRIEIGDQLDIKFFYNPTLNEQVIVRPDGRISLQLVHEVVVAGLTPGALTKELTDRYALDLKQPEVTVIVRSFGAQRVFVDGEVARPGVVPILGVTTALQAIAQAGGLKDSARASEILVIRRGEINKPMALQIDLKKARDGRNLGEDISLVPFDIVFVPRSRMSNVNVWMEQYIRKNIPIPFGLQYGILQ